MVRVGPAAALALAATLVAALAARAETSGETPDWTQSDATLADGARPVILSVDDDNMTSTSLQEAGWYSRMLGRQAPDVDLRRTGCLNPAQDQGPCASCTLFVATAQMEYMYCREHGKRIKFSEQLLLDCGEPFGMLGCSGADAASVTQFISQVGVKEEADYTYKGTKKRCPYYSQREKRYRFDDAADFRPRLAGRKSVEYKKWSGSLQLMIPLHVGVWINNTFEDYKAGEIIRSCDNPQTSHAVLLIGEGRQGNEDFWLLRNSYGPAWGDEGHFRLSKQAAKCFTENGTGYFQRAFLDMFGNKLVPTRRPPDEQTAA